MKHRLVALALIACPIACKSAPPAAAVPTEALVEQVVLDAVTLAPSGLCGGADWTGAMACADASCVAQAAGAECVSCVAQAQACIDGRSSGCAELCVDCLGADRCAELDNVALAASHLEPVADRGYFGQAAIAHRIGPRATFSLYGVTPDDLRLIGVIPLGSRSGLNVTEPDTLLVDATGRVLRAWDAQCNVATSPKGTWILETCAGRALVRELRTGFLRAEFEFGEGSPPGRYSFGGERFLLVRGIDQHWTRHDLLDGTTAPVLGVYQLASADDVSLSPDGLHVAEAMSGKVWPIGAPEDVTYQPTSRAGGLLWIDASAILLGFADQPPQVVSIAAGRVLREVSVPDANEHLYWELHLVRDEIVWLARNDVWPRLKFEDGPEHHIELVKGYTPYQVLAPTNVISLARESGFGASAAGDVVFATKFGDFTWSPTGLRDPEALRGDILWFNAGRPGELLVGMSTGAAAIDIETGKVSLLDLPADYRLIDVRRAGDTLVALGSKPGEEETERRKSVLIRDGSGDAIIELEAEPLVATLDADRRLHVIDDIGLRTYVDGKLTKTTKREPWDKRIKTPDHAKFQPGSLITQGGPPRALPSQGLLSRDGSRALFVQQEKAILIRTQDHKVLRTWAARSCVFARRTNVVGCLETRGERGAVEIITYDATSSPISAMDAQITGSEIVEVSDDGERVMTGNPVFQTTRAHWDLTRVSLVDLPIADPARHFFHPDGRLIQLSPTYLEIFDNLPAP